MVSAMSVWFVRLPKAPFADQTHRIFPLDDYYECLLRGAPKEVRFVSARKHMGEPEAFIIILGWLYKLFGLEGSPGDQMRTIPSRPKY